MNTTEPTPEGSKLISDLLKEISKSDQDETKIKMLAEALEEVDKENADLRQQVYEMNNYKIQAYDQLKELADLRAALAELIRNSQTMVSTLEDHVSAQEEDLIRYKSAIERAKKYAP